MRMAVGSDQQGALTKAICEHLGSKGIETVMVGALKERGADYCDAARAVGEAVASGECEQGLIFCFTGTGVTIVANKVPGVRAALCVDAYAAEVARAANNANVLVLSIRITGEPLAKEIVDRWLAIGPSTEPRRMAFHRKTEEMDQLFRDGRAARDRSTSSTCGA